MKIIIHVCCSQTVLINHIMMYRNRGKLYPNKKSNSGPFSNSVDTDTTWGSQNASMEALESQQYTNHKSIYTKDV